MGNGARPRGSGRNPARPQPNPALSPPVRAEQFKGGQSNPTYRLATAAGSYVLRRQPSGALLKSAHAVDREFRVLQALHGGPVPVAKPLHLCTDESVIGSMFYVMDKVEGRVLWDLKLPGMEPAARRAIYESQVDTLAALHAFDPAAINLLLADLKSTAEGFVRAGTSAPVTCEITAFMRYAGQGWEIPVALPFKAFSAADTVGFKARFEEAEWRMHEKGGLGHGAFMDCAHANG